MKLCHPIRASVRSLLQLRCFRQQTGGHMGSIIFPPRSGSHCIMHSLGHSANTCVSVTKTSAPSPLCCFKAFNHAYCGFGLSNKRKKNYTLMAGTSSFSGNGRGTCTEYKFGPRRARGSVWLLVTQGAVLNNLRPFSWSQRFTTVGLVFGLLICCSSSNPVHAYHKNDEGEQSDGQVSHGKKVHTNYSVIGIPGDGRCLFRSVAHGACIRSGKPVPSESLQRELADELRARVADEFIKRREETEWFIEGDFDTYVSEMRKPHVWGGEPELLMLSHVLGMPITVYIRDKQSGGLISIAEYGQEYGKDSPITVLYHGFGHYDALSFPRKAEGRSRL